MRELPGPHLSAAAAQGSHRPQQPAARDLPGSWSTGLVELPAVAALN